MKRQVLVLLLVGLVAIEAVAAPVSRTAVRQLEPLIMTGLEDVSASSGIPAARPIPTPLDDWTPGSEVDTMGWTWYDYQTNGTNGKQIGVDASGWVHTVWTNGVNQGSIPRHVYYNVWNPETQRFVHPEGSPDPLGVQVDGAAKAGFVNIAVDPEGWAYPLFHQSAHSDGTDPHAAGAIDFLPTVGAFTPSEIPYPGIRQIIWPHVAIDISGNLHVVTTETSTGSEDFYAKGIPEFQDGFGSTIDWGDGYLLWEPANFITIDVAASWHSKKIAVAWINAALGNISGNNVYVRVSEDAGETWGPVRNITNFQLIDTTCLEQFEDIPLCNGDTLRPWIDLSVFIDRDDVVHVAFSTNSWYYWWTDGTVGPWTLTARPSMIFHWDEVNNEYNRVADGWFGHNDSTASFGVNQLMCHRPSLAQDTTTGYLYCSYMLYDTVQINDCGHPLADAFVSVSMNGGRDWAVGTNVTNTVGVEGNDRSERDITLALAVTDGNVHMQYLVDHSAGSYVASNGPECEETFNEMIYQRIPVEDIATTPLLSHYPIRTDSTGLPGETHAGNVPAELPELFSLYQNYPNPFNPSTKIQFDLRAASEVSLTVYDVTGREVARLLQNESLNAGTHVIAFDASSLSTGVYFYQLASADLRVTRKMMLVK